MSYNSSKVPNVYYKNIQIRSVYNIVESILKNEKQNNIYSPPKTRERTF